jgi:hypothetical protein
MLTLVQFNLVTLLVALLIGAAAGRWAFAKRSASDQQPEDPTRS